MIRIILDSIPANATNLSNILMHKGKFYGRSYTTSKLSKFYSVSAIIGIGNYASRDSYSASRQIVALLVACTYDLHK